MKRLITLIAMVAMAGAASAALMVTNNTQHLITFETDIAGAFVANVGDNEWSRNVIEPDGNEASPLNANRGPVMLSTSWAARHVWHNDGLGGGVPTYFLADANNNGTTDQVLGSNQMGMYDGAGATSNHAYRVTLDGSWADTGLYLRIQNNTGAAVTDWTFNMDVYFGEADSDESTLQYSYAVDNGTAPGAMTYTTFGAALSSVNGDVITGPAKTMNETVTTTGVAAGGYIVLQIDSKNTSGGASDVYLDNIGVTAVFTPVTEIPSTPENLSATALSVSEIDLSWDDVSGDEDGFYIERGASIGTLAIISTNPANVSVFSDSGLTQSTEYFYRVTAFNVIGNSTNNPTTSETTFDPAPPLAPSDLEAAGISGTAANLVWVDNSNNEDGFEIWRKLGTGSFSLVTTTASGVTFFEDTGLTAASEYTYRVRGVNGIGDSAYTDEAAASSLSAATLVYEPFVYGGNVGDSLSSAAPASSAEAGVVANMRAVLSFAGSTSYGFAAATTTVGWDRRDISSFAFTAEGTFYISGLFQADIEGGQWGGYALTAFTLSNDVNANNHFWIGLCNSDTNGAGALIRPYAGFGRGDAVPGTNANFAVGSTDLTDASTYFLLAKVEVSGNGADISLLVVEDGGTIPQSEPTTWDTTVSVANINLDGDLQGIFNRLGVAQWNTPPVAKGENNLSDEFRLATTYAAALPASGSAYNIWADAYGLVEGPDGHDDDDGMPNFYEYALGGDPTNSADIGIVQYGDDGAGFFTYIHGKRLDDASLVYTLEDTEELVSGTINTDDWDSQTSGPSGETGFDAVTNKYDMTGKSAHFIHLIIE